MEPAANHSVTYHRVNVSESLGWRHPTCTATTAAHIFTGYQHHGCPSTMAPRGQWCNWCCNVRRKHAASALTSQQLVQKTTEHEHIVPSSGEGPASLSLRGQPGVPNLSTSAQAWPESTWCTRTHWTCHHCSSAALLLVPQAATSMHCNIFPARCPLPPCHTTT